MGKSVITSNLGLLLARQGKRVVLADLDIGGANLHIIFGLINPELSLTDFLNKRVDSLEEVIYKVEWASGLGLIPGTGETLGTANLPYAKKTRLIRHLQHLDADIVLLDCAPGPSFQTLDFFLLGDIQLAVATPDPTAVIELYTFLKLAAIRKVLTSLVANDRSKVKAQLMEENFSSVQEVIEVLKDVDPASQEMAEDALREFHPLFILNQMTPSTKLSVAYLQQVVYKFIRSELELIGKIPQDEAVEQSIRIFQPVVDLAPQSQAAKALRETMHGLLAHIENHKGVFAA